MTKICEVCHQDLSLELYSKDKSQQDGHCRKCKACTRLYHMSYYRNNRERVLQRTREHAKLYLRRPSVQLHRKLYKTKYWHANPEKSLLKGALARSRQLGLPFNLDLSDIVIPSHCPILGIELVKNYGNHKANSPTLDRLDNSKGYIKGNVKVISFKANERKRDLSVDDLERMICYMRGQL